MKDLSKAVSDMIIELTIPSSSGLPSPSAVENAVSQHRQLLLIPPAQPTTDSDSYFTIKTTPTACEMQHSRLFYHASLSRLAHSETP
jgi:hypothetical protein